LFFFVFLLLSAPHVLLRQQPSLPPWHQRTGIITIQFVWFGYSFAFSWYSKGFGDGAWVGLRYSSPLPATLDTCRRVAAANRGTDTRPCSQGPRTRPEPGLCHNHPPRHLLLLPAHVRRAFFTTQTQQDK
jgi:hypothetical protein